MYSFIFPNTLFFNSKALPKFLLSVPRADRNAVQEMYYLLDKWAEIQPLDALEVLTQFH
jgi:hypothetical protein